MEQTEKPRLPHASTLSRKVEHTKRHADAYTWVDNDLARDNLENDLPEADKQNH